MRAGGPHHRCWWIRERERDRSEHGGIVERSNIFPTSVQRVYEQTVNRQLCSLK